MYEAFKSVLTIPVIDRNGKLITSRTFDNPPFMFLYPGELIALIDWKAGAEGLPSIEQMLQPVVVQRDIVPDRLNKYTYVIRAGTKFWGYFIWGSGAKNGITIGIQRDLLKESIGAGPIDGQRGHRMYLANCMYGAAKLKKVKVLILGKKDVVPGLGYPMADGFDYYDEDLIEVARQSAHVDQSDNKIEPQEPEAASDNYSRDQRVPLMVRQLIGDGPETEWVSTGVWEENVPYLQEAITELTTKPVEAKNVQNLNEAHEKSKAELVLLEPLMAKHSYVAHSLQRKRARDAARLSSSFPMKSKVRLMVPTTAPIAALPRGRWVINGMPITSYNAMRAVTITKADRAEINRIKAMPVAQTTIVSPDIFSKGQGGIIKGLKEKTGYDIIMCSENIKMASVKYNYKDGARLLKEIEIDGGFIGLLAYTAAGHAIGINPQVAEEMSRDYDGDYAYITDCSARPAYWTQVKQFPVQASPKLPKIAGEWPKDAQGNEIEDRPRLILETMDDIIGFATNLMSGTFTMMDHDGFATEQMAYQAMDVMDDLTTWFCRIGEDLFKTDLSKIKNKKTGKPLTIKTVKAEMGAFQDLLTKKLGRMPTYCGWRRDPEAFKTMVPEVWSHALDGLEKTDARVRTSLNPGWTGTIATIGKYALPQLQAILEAPIEHLPLMEFQLWAEEQGAVLTTAAEGFQASFNTQIVHLNWGDKRSTGAVGQFMLWLQIAVDEMLAETGATPWQMANAVWYVAHGSRSLRAGAASVFLAFPNEARRIVVEKPGLAVDVKRSVLVGLAPGVVHTKATGMIKSFHTAKKGGVIVRGFVPDNPKLLKAGNAFAGIPTDAAQLKEGRVLLQITWRAGASWSVEVLARL